MCESWLRWLEYGQQKPINALISKSTLFTMKVMVEDEEEITLDWDNKKHDLLWLAKLLPLLELKELEDAYSKPEVIGNDYWVEFISIYMTAILASDRVGSRTVKTIDLPPWGSTCTHKNSRLGRLHNCQHVP